MKKPSRSRKGKNKALVMILVLVAVLILASAATGHRAEKLYYGYRVRAALTSQNKKLNNPLQTLGFNNTKAKKTTCVYAQEYGYTGIKLQCTQEIDSYQVLPTDKASKAELMAKVNAVDSLLAKNGWRVESTSISPWFQNVLDGIDYQPDDFNYFHYGNTICILDFVTAFSKPKPPAIGATMMCSMPEPKGFGGQP